ncbi:MAG TPA: hypothetical protein VF100_05615 [Thermoanaerobaculia bacterium]
MPDFDAATPSHLDTASPITDDAWPAEAIAACLPAGAGADDRRDGEEDAR